MSSCSVMPLFGEGHLATVSKKLDELFSKDTQNFKGGELILVLKDLDMFALEYNPDDEYSSQDFKDSIDRLKEYCINYAKDVKLPNNYIEDEFKNVYFEKINEAEDDPNKEVDLEGDLPIERELSDDYERLLRGNTALIDFFGNEVFHNIFELSLVQRTENLQSSRIIRTERDLNLGMVTYMNKLAKVLHDFLKDKKEFLEKHQVRSLATLKYNSNFELNTQHFPLLMVLFSTYLEELIELNEDDYVQTLNNDFIEMSNTSERKGLRLLEAVNAYLMLEHFDDVLDAEVSFIKHKNYSSPIFLEKNSKGDIVDNYKYSFKVTNSLRGKWEDTISDGIKQMGKFASRLIEYIPKKLGGYLTTRDFVTAFLRLRSTVNLISKNSSWEIALKNAFYDLDNSDLVEAMYNILRILLKNTEIYYTSLSGKLTFFRNNPDSVKKKLMGVTKLGQDTLIESDFELFDDVYRFLFGDRSKVGIWQIENQENERSINLSTYSICSSIISAFTTSCAVNYLDTHYNNKGELVVSDMKKSKMLNEVFELKRRAHSKIFNTNGYSIDYQLKDMLLKTIRIFFPDNRYRLEIETDEKTLLFEGQNSTKSIKVYYNNDGAETVVDVEELVKELKDLSSKGSPSSNVESYINHNLSKGHILKQLLSFIDSELLLGLSDNTKILDQLIKYYGTKVLESTLEKKGGQSFSPLNRLIMAASKVLGAADINSRYKEYKLNTDPEDIKSFDDWFNDLAFIIEDKDGPMRRLLSNELLNRYIFLNEPQSGKVMVGAAMYEGETIFDDYVKAKHVISGDYNKSTTTNGNNDRIPNVSKAYMDIWQETLRTSAESALDPTSSYITDHLLFTDRNINAVINITVDSEYNTRWGETKQISDFTNPELLAHDFLDKFLIPIKDGRFIAQPVCYSDKKKFLNFLIDLQEIGFFRTGQGDSQQALKEWVMKSDADYAKAVYETLGRYYKNLLYNIAYDYNKIFWNRPFLTNGNFSDESIYTEDKFEANEERIKNILFETELKLKTMSAETFRKLAYSRGVEVFEELHYRPLGKNYCTINEIVVKLALDTYRGDYTVTEIIDGKPTVVQKNSIVDAIREQTREYVNSLMSSYTLLNVSNPSFALVLESILGESGMNAWISKGNLILAKKINKTTGEAIENYILSDPIDEKTLNDDEFIQYNPLIKLRVRFSSLINENIRHQIAGTEAFHKIKMLPNIEVLSEFNDEEKGLIKGAINQLLGQLATANPVDIVTVSDLKYIIDHPTSVVIYETLMEKIKDVYSRLSSRIQSLGVLAQSKRTVADPGTIRRFDQGKIDGIASEYIYAVVDDCKANVFDFSGEYGWSKTKTIDAHDGSAHITALTAILENNSLDDNEVGLEVKKPLWDVDIPKYGGRKLVKYASDTITNNLMRSSEGSYYSLGKVFKKMTDIRWGDDEIDLTRWDGVFGDYFDKHILNGVGQLFYEHNDIHSQILDFGRDEDGTYYTIEENVNANGRPYRNPRRKVYHYFRDNGEHIRSTLKMEGLQTINSIYRLWQAMGGMYCESLVNGNLEYSEASNYVVVNFMNNVRVATQKCIDYENSGAKDPIPQNQSFYYQPLKHKLISYIIYKSAMKNGYSNVNTFEDLLDENKELRTAKSNTKKYGTQLDTDHTADEAEVSEMSQVISSLDSGGFYHEEIKELYEAIGEQILKAAEVELSALRRALKSHDFSELYRVVGNTLINNFSENRGKAGLMSGIIRNIKKTFNLKEDQLLEAFKIPFSDHNVYNLILSTVATLLNGKSIKRKYSGIGQVMTPSFGIYLIYEIDGYKMLYFDVLKAAKLYYRANKDKAPKNISDTILYNRALVNSYLAEKCPDTDVVDWTGSESWTQDLRFELLRNYDPLNKVRVTYSVDGSEPKEIILDLNTIPNYYNFKESPTSFVKESAGFVGKENVRIISTSIIRSIPRDLAPARVHISYNKGGKIIHRNIFDTWPYLRLNELLKARKQNEDIIKKYLKEIIPRFLRNLDKKIYEDSDGTLYDIESAKYEAAETVMSNVYATRFGLDSYVSMHDVDIKPDYFKSNINVNEIDSEKYEFDFQLINLNNRNNIYISLSPGNSSEFYSLKKLSYPKSKLRRIKVNKGNVIDSIYIMNSENVPLYEIGRSVLAKGVKYNEELEAFEDEQGNVIEGRDFYFDSLGNICEQIIFLNKYKVYPKKGKYPIIKFCIDTNALKRCTIVEGKNTNADYLRRKEITNIVYSLYNSDKYALLEPAYSIDINHYDDVMGTLSLLRKKFESEGNIEISDYISNLLNNVFTISSSRIKKAAEENENIKYVRLNAGRKFTDEEVKKIFGEIGEEDIKFVRENILLPTIRDNEIDMYLKRRFKIADEEQRIKLIGEINKLKEEHDLGKMITWNKKYMESLSKKRFTSFQKSKFFTSSRIPAQNLQSFMKMECVGFTGVGTNICAVSHWQAFLQGSDYDIDKSYMMGLEFDNNGIFIGWSNLFDYTNIETLNASEALPLSKNVGITNNENISDESSFILDYGLGYAHLKNDDTTKNRVDRLELIGKILKDFYKSGKTNIKFRGLSEVDAKAILEDMKRHDSYEYSPYIRDLMLKNFISLGIQRISSKFGNLMASYTPVEMEYLRETLEKAPKAKELEGLNPINPAMTPLLQVINMTGKAVTGIAANAQKAQYIWRFAVLEALRQGVDLDKARFDKEFTGIEGRWLGELGRTSKLLFLSDFDLDDELKAKLQLLVGEDYKKTNIPVDSVTSQVISAATDNAKELILGAINAGNKLAKCHLYLMTLGFDAKDIAAFMFSPLISLIDKVTEPNIITGLNIQIKYFTKYVKNYFEYLLDEEKKTKIPSLGKSVSLVIKERIVKLLNSLVTSKNENGEEYIDKGKVQMYLNDINTFKQVFDGANEFSTLGRGLGINQGVKAVNKELISWMNSLRNIITETFDKLKDNEKDEDFSKAIILNKYGMTLDDFKEKFKDILGGNFDVTRWLTDENYRTLTEEYYDPVKETLNPFYIFNHVDHFSSMFTVAGYAAFVNSEISMKSRLMKRYSETMRAKYPNAPFDYEYKFQSVIDKLLIGDFITSQGIEIPVQPNWTAFNEYFLEQIINSDTFIINNIYDLSSFRKIMDEYIIPGLLNGTIPIYSDFENGLATITDNPFIKGLILTDDKGIPFYKLNIDMLEKDDSYKDRILYEDYKRGLRKLFNIRLSENGISVADLFILYNFIVHGNHAGSERLTTIFLDVLSKDFNLFVSERSYLYKYYEWLGEMDNPREYRRRVSKMDEYLENYSLLDILIESAPIKSSTDLGGLAPIIRTISPTGEYVYHEWVGYNNYKEMTSTLIPIPGETDASRLDRLINLFKYGYGNQYSTYTLLVSNSFKLALNGDTSSINVVWKQLTINGTINYTLKCV